MTAEEIKSLRVSLGLTQDQFAQRLKVACITVNRWENSQKKPSRLAEGALQRLARKAGR
jgi:putative transcriptional regulator